MAKQHSVSQMIEDQLTKEMNKRDEGPAACEIEHNSGTNPAQSRPVSNPFHQTRNINQSLNVGRNTLLQKSAPDYCQEHKTKKKVSVALTSTKKISIRPSCRAIATVLARIPQSFYNIKSNEWIFNIEHYDAVSSELAKVNVIFESIPAGTLRMAARRVGLSRPALVGGIYDCLMQFQREAVFFAINRGGRVLLADDMGLGKTLQALAIANYYCADYPLLIIAPASLLGNWEVEVQHFLGEESSIIRTRDAEFTRISIISYTFATAFLENNRSYKPGVVICDECHYLKSMTSKRTKRILPLLQSAARLVMVSGTPALSRPLELYPIFMALDRRIFPQFGVYGTRYCNGRKIGRFYDYRGCSNANELNVALEHAFMLRRMKSAVLSELPSKFRRQILLECPKATLDQSLSVAAQDLLEVKDKPGLAGSQESSILVEFCNTAKLKRKPVLEYLATVLERGTKTVVFAHHQDMLNGLEEYAKTSKYRYIRIDGSTPSSKRHMLIGSFQEDEEVVLAILSITACSSGITLTAGKALVFAELYWNPGILLQAEDRIHRIGQLSSVDIHYLVAKNTVDEIVWPHILKKLNVLESLGIGKNELRYIKSEEEVSGQKKLDKYVKRI